MPPDGFLARDRGPWPRGKRGGQQLAEAVGEDTGRVTHVHGQVGRQDLLDHCGRGTAREPRGDGGSEPVHLPLGQGETVVGAAQAGEERE